MLFELILGWGLGCRIFTSDASRSFFLLFSFGSSLVMGCLFIRYPILNRGAVYNCYESLVY